MYHLPLKTLAKLSVDASLVIVDDNAKRPPAQTIKSNRHDSLPSLRLCKTVKEAKRRQSIGTDHIQRNRRSLKKPNGVTRCSSLPCRWGSCNQLASPIRSRSHDSLPMEQILRVSTTLARADSPPRQPQRRQKSQVALPVNDGTAVPIAIVAALDAIPRKPTRTGSGKMTDVARAVSLRSESSKGFSLVRSF